MARRRPFENTVMNRRVPRNVANFLLDDKTLRYNGLPVPQRSPFVSVPSYTPQTYLKGKIVGIFGMIPEDRRNKG